MRKYDLLGPKPKILWPSSIYFHSPSKGETDFELSMSSLVAIYEGQLLDPILLSMSSNVQIILPPLISKEMSMSAKVQIILPPLIPKEMSMSAKVALNLT